MIVMTPTGNMRSHISRQVDWPASPMPHIPGVGSATSRYDALDPHREPTLWSSTAHGRSGKADPSTSLRYGLDDNHKLGISNTNCSSFRRLRFRYNHTGTVTPSFLFGDNPQLNISARNRWMGIVVLGHGHSPERVFARLSWCLQRQRIRLCAERSQGERCFFNRCLLTHCIREDKPQLSTSLSILIIHHGNGVVSRFQRLQGGLPEVQVHAKRIEGLLHRLLKMRLQLQRFQIHEMVRRERLG